MLLENEGDIILFLNIESKNKLDKIKYDFKIPEMLKYNPKKENKHITEENIIFEDEGGKDIFTPFLELYQVLLEQIVSN